MSISGKGCEKCNGTGRVTEIEAQREREHALMATLIARWEAA